VAFQGYPKYDFISHLSLALDHWHESEKMTFPYEFLPIENLTVITVQILIHNLTGISKKGKH